jgi:hypothetical protein
MKILNFLECDYLVQISQLCGNSGGQIRIVRQVQRAQRGYKMMQQRQATSALDAIAVQMQRLQGTTMGGPRRHGGHTLIAQFVPIHQ